MNLRMYAYSNDVQIKQHLEKHIIPFFKDMKYKSFDLSEQKRFNSKEVLKNIEENYKNSTNNKIQTSFRKPSDLKVDSFDKKKSYGRSRFEFIKKSLGIQKTTDITKSDSNGKFPLKNELFLDPVTKTYGIDSSVKKSV